jgi:putative FmdB family regulatory protein
MAQRGSERNKVMPTYTFICEDCNNKFELFFTIREYKEKPKCDRCGKNHTCRSYQDDLSSVTGSVIKSDSELKTLGDLANRNRDKLSEDRKKDLHYKHNNYKEDFHLKLPSGMSRIKKPNKYGR